jgi:hypothetical protein
MAGDWTKVENVTPDKPEIAILARKLGVSLGDAFLSWFKLYRWAGGITTGGNVPFLSGSDADALSGAIPGTCDVMASEEVGWVKANSEGRPGITFVKWELHNSKAAKARALDAARKRGDRGEVPPVFREMSGCEPENGRTRQEESKRRDKLLKSNREAISSSAQPAPCDGLRSRLPKDLSSDAETLGPDLSQVDWDLAVSMAEAVARKIPPRSPEDRRNWIRFGVLAQSVFSENWLMDGVEAVMRAQVTKRTKQAHLYGVLKAKAGEILGVGGDTFAGIVKRIKVPDDVWKLGVLEIRE